MLRLSPNNTYRFTVCGNPKMEMREPPPMIRNRLPRQRWVIPIMQDDSIFFDKIDVGRAIFSKMAEAIRGGQFKFGLQRFEVKVDSSAGPSGYYNVRPLDWEHIPSPPSTSSYQECECECHC